MNRFLSAVCLLAISASAIADPPPAIPATPKPLPDPALQMGDKPERIAVANGDKVGSKLCVSPDGKRALVWVYRAEASGRTPKPMYYLVDVGTDLGVDLSTGRPIFDWNFSGDGKSALATCSGNTLLVDLDKHKLRIMDELAVWSGEQIVAMPSKQTITPPKVLSAEGKEIRKLDIRAGVLMASRDGKVWVGCGDPKDLTSPITPKDSRFQVIALTSEGKVVRAIGPTTEVEPTLRISPSGKYAAFVRRPKAEGQRGIRQLVLMEIQSGKESMVFAVEPMGPDGTLDFNRLLLPLAVSDDGLIVVMERAGASDVKVRTYDADGNGKVLVERAAAAGASDTKLIYATLKDGRLEFATMELPRKPAK